MSTQVMWPKYDQLGGYVTQWASLKHMGIPALEQALGFNPGALGDGYVVYGLADRVKPDDFDWRDRTRYSGGWHADSSIEFGGAGEIWSVQRIDELRASLGKKFNYDEARVDQELGAMQRRWEAEMNVCFGDQRIVKVRALRQIRSFPDSPLRGVRQWEFRQGVRKQFELMFFNQPASSGSR